MMSGQSRSGLVTICVLACLLVATSLAWLAMQSALRERREITLRHQMLQTEFLLDAGVRRAVRQSRSSADDEGETWQPELKATSFPNPLVQIRRISDEQIEVVAMLGLQPSDPARTSASLTRRSRVLSLPNSIPIQSPLPRSKP